MAIWAIILVVFLVALLIGLIVYFAIRNQRKKTLFEKVKEEFDKIPTIQCPKIPGFNTCQIKENFFVYLFTDKRFRINQSGNTYITLNGKVSTVTSSETPQWDYNGSRIYNSLTDTCLTYSAEGIIAQPCRNNESYDFLFDGYNFYLASTLGQEMVLQLSVTTEGNFNLVAVPRNRVGVAPSNSSQQSFLVV